RGRGMDHPAFRENALRQRTVAAALRPRRPHVRGARLRTSRARNLRLAATRDDHAGWRLLKCAGCRQRRPRGEILFVDERRTARLAGRSGIRRDRGGVRPGRHTQLRGPRLASVKARTFDQIAQAMEWSPLEIQLRLNSARLKLFDARSRRARPMTDDKVLVAWNALMISGLLRGAREAHQPEFAKLGERALAALRDGAWFGGALYANAVTDARARIPGFLDDHAFLLDALVESLQDRWNDEDLAWAMALADALLEKFLDKENGGFFFSAAEHATPLQNPKGFMDEALPNGNGTAARALLRLGHLLGETRWLDAAQRTLRAAGSALRQYPDACAAMLRALHEFDSPRTQVVIRCSEAEQATWRAALDDALQTQRIDRERIDVFIIPSDAKSLPGLLAQRKPLKGGVAYVCSGMSCLAPIDSPHALSGALRLDQSTIG